MKLKELLKGDKKKGLGIYILLLAGVLLLAFGSVPKSGEPETAESTPAASPAEGEYIALLEERLAETLSSIDGAGSVRVMLVAENSGSVTVGKDADGAGEKTVVLNKQGGSEALVLAENSPGLCGALIIAEGAGSDRVRAELSEAAATVLGLGIHRVRVYKMQKNI